MQYIKASELGVVDEQLIVFFNPERSCQTEKRESKLNRNRKTAIALFMTLNGLTLFGFIVLLRELAA